MAKATHKVVHPKLYLSVDGKIQKIKLETPMHLTDEQAKKYGDKVEKIVSIPTLEVATPAPES